MDKFLFLFYEGFRNIFRHKGTVFVSILTTTITFSIFGGLLIINENSTKLPELFRSKYKIEVFFYEHVSNKSANKIMQNIAKKKIVKNVKFITKEEALLFYKDEFDEDIIEILGYNPLPAGCLIYLDEKQANSKIIDNFINNIENIEEISSTHYLGKLISKLERIYSLIHGLVKLLVGIVLIISIYFILNTVKLTVYSRAELIKTLSMVGATSLFIKIPFIIEGLFQSILGALFSFGLLSYMVSEINKISSDWNFINLSMEFPLLFWLLSVSIIIGYIGSYKAVSKFL